MTPLWKIRPIQPRDDAAVAAIIRSVMPEFGAVGDGYSINDTEVDRMQGAYSQPRCTYFIVELDGRVMGGGGIGPLKGGEDDTCELRKMYFLPPIRGMGIGRALLSRCLDAARGFGYRRCYLETMRGMHAAISLYERAGFRRVGTPVGKTGHSGCNTFYLLDLLPPPPRSEESAPEQAESASGQAS